MENGFGKDKYFYTTPDGRVKKKKEPSLKQRTQERIKKELLENALYNEARAQDLPGELLAQAEEANAIEYPFDPLD